MNMNISDGNFFLVISHPVMQEGDELDENKIQFTPVYSPSLNALDDVLAENFGDKVVLNVMSLAEIRAYTQIVTKFKSDFLSAMSVNQSK